MALLQWFATLYTHCKDQLPCYTTHVDYAQWPVSHTHDTHCESHEMCLQTAKCKGRGVCCIRLMSPRRCTVYCLLASYTNCAIGCYILTSAPEF